MNINQTFIELLHDVKRCAQNDVTTIKLTFAGLGLSPSPEEGLTANAVATQVVMVSGTGTLSEVMPSGLQRNGRVRTKHRLPLSPLKRLVLYTYIEIYISV